MRLTTRGRYAVTAMLDLALQPEGTQVSLRDISSRQDISVAYLEQLFSKLKKRELVKSIRGSAGGYLLSRPADQIVVLEIIAAVNESVDATACEGHANCHHGATCLTHHLWTDLSEHIESYLSKITLACLIERRETQLVGLKSAKAPDFGHDHNPFYTL